MRTTGQSTASVAVLIVVAASACSDPAAPGQPDGFADDLALSSAVDLDPDPHVLEVRLVAKPASLELRPGTSTEAWTYGGTIPGPLLRLTQGDRLVVHFENDLPEATTIHFHGVRLPNEMDGAVPHSQEPVPPGGSFDYDFVVPDAGLFWYHPHEDSAKQLGFGLYGALLVDPAEPDPPELGDEVVMVLSDVALDDDAKLVPADNGGDIATQFGREGTDILVNGKTRPKLFARIGARQRWRIVNAAKSRYFQIMLPGQELVRIGGDTGRLAKPERADRVLILPGGRADVVVTPRGAPGETLPLHWLPYNRGFGTVEYRDPEPIADVVLVGPDAQAPPLPTDLGGTIAEPLDTTGATPIEISLTQATGADGHVVMGIDGVPFDEATPFPASVGETQIWTVKNTMAWAHPFHLHGFFFQEVDESGRPVEPVEWRDTADVPVDGALRFAVRYDNRPGVWMFHCHILDHADAGMMGMISVSR
jgi:FtsP/CotA-like multicopper oxidase with cupredoxin domain